MFIWRRFLLVFVFVPGLFSWHPVCMSFAVSLPSLHEFKLSTCHSRPSTHAHMHTHTGERCCPHFSNMIQARVQFVIVCMQFAAYSVLRLTNPDCVYVSQCAGSACVHLCNSSCSQFSQNSLVPSFKLKICFCLFSMRTCSTV